MARYEFRTPRLLVETGLSPDARLDLPASQLHYLKDVLRLKPGDRVLVFNGRDGEWSATLAPGSKRSMTLLVDTQTRPQTPPCDFHYLFAPLKRSRLDYMIQKAVEMGASRLQPVITRHTQAERVNTARMRANAIEAAEQCGILSIPEVEEPLPLDRALAALTAGRIVIFCDEDAPNADPLAALKAAYAQAGRSEHPVDRVLTSRLFGADGQMNESAPKGQRDSAGFLPSEDPHCATPLSASSKSGFATAAERPPLALLVGPEGGFHQQERDLLLNRDGVIRLALGPRILRADTAAVAALALVQAVLGDWR